MKTINFIKTLLALMFVCLHFNSVLGQLNTTERIIYADSVKDEWWFPFVEKHQVKLNDFIDYDKAPEHGNLFINGNLEQNNDTLKIFKNGIAFGKLGEKYSVYYFNVFKIEQIDFELSFEKYEYYSIDSLNLLETRQYEGEYFWMRTEREKNNVQMQTRRKM